MKRIASLVLALQATLLTSYAGSIQPVGNDTVIVIRNAQKVTIEQNDSILGIEIEGKEDNPRFYYSQRREVRGNAAVITQEKSGVWDFNVPFSKKKKTQRSHYYAFEMGAPSIGWVSALNAPEGMDVDMGASYELMWDKMLNWVYYPTKGNFSFSMGLGLNWKNFRMTGRTRFIKEVDNLVLSDYPEGADIQFSRIKVFSLMVPLMYNQRIYRNISFSVGPVLNFNTYASLKTRYKLDGEKTKEMDKNLHQSPVTIDLMARFSFRVVGLYVKYSPCNVLHTDFGPKFNALSAGITLFLH